MAVIFGLSTLLAYLPGLVCIGMLFVCGRMLFGGHDGPHHADEITQLREEVAQLRAERDASKAEEAIRE
jgi:hypothetical protein